MQWILGFLAMLLAGSSSFQDPAFQVKNLMLIQVIAITALS